MNLQKHKSVRLQPGIKRIQNYLFKFVDLLGKGNFSSVYKGINQLTNQIVAIKYIALSSLTCERLKQLLDQQIEIITSLSHPNIVKCFEVLKSSHNCYIVTELCDGGDLQGLLKKKQRLTEDEIIPYVRDIFQGLYYLSKKNIVHRDIKLANIFLSKGKAKIADFGFAQRAKKQFNDGKIGTPLCMSPEGFLQNLYGCKTDVWAFGIILYQLTHGKLHLEHCTSEQSLRRQIQTQLKIEQLRPQLSPQLKQLILKCLDVNPCTRITFQEMKNVAFIKKITLNRTEPFSMQNLRYIPSLHTNHHEESPNSSFMVSLKSIDNPQFNHLDLKEKLTIGKQNEHHNFAYGTNKICEDLKPQNFALKIQKTQKCICRPPKIEVPVNTMTYISTKKEEQKQNISQQNPVRENPFQSDFQIRISHKSHSTLPAQNSKVLLNTPEKDKSLISTTDRQFLQVPSSPANFPFRRHKGSFQLGANEKLELQSPSSVNLRATSSTTRQNVQKNDDSQLSATTLTLAKRQKIPMEVCPITNTRRLLNGFMKFNQAIGLIHYCRLIYKYIIELKATGIYHEGDLNLRYYSCYLLNLLNELVTKITTDHIILTKVSTDDVLKENKLSKMQKVIEEYIERYKPNLEKQRADYLNRTTGQIKQIVHLDQKFIENFFIPDKTKISNYNSKLVKFSEILERCSRYQKYSEFDSNKELQDVTKQKQRTMFNQKHPQNIKEPSSQSAQKMPQKSVSFQLPEGQIPVIPQRINFC